MGASYESVANPLVVITGGEPFRQNIIPLIKGLRVNRFEVQVETNGTLSPWGREPIPKKHPQFGVVVSPKAGKVHEDLWALIIAYKYVVNAGSVLEKDGLPSSVLGLPAAPARPHEGYRGPIYVQPAEEKNTVQYTTNLYEADEQKNEMNLRRAIKSTMQFGYILCLQTHKLIGME
jgi:organic radical activating enzyme